MPYKDKKQKAAYDAERRMQRREQERAYKKAKYLSLTPQERSQRAQRARERHLLNRFGITIQEWDKILEAQGGGCGICGGPPNGIGRYHVDHDHATGKIRGLLCYKHNALLGWANDNIEILQAAIDYLKGTIKTCS